VEPHGVFASDPQSHAKAAYQKSFKVHLWYFSSFLQSNQVYLILVVYYIAIISNRDSIALTVWVAECPKVNGAMAWGYHLGSEAIESFFPKRNDSEKRKKEENYVK
jgi:hypothetical protein